MKTLDKILEDVEETSFNEDVVYSEILLKESGLHLEVIKDEKLIVVYTEDNEWYDFAFLEWAYSSDDGDYYSKFMKVSGPSGNLRECRHSYIGDKGYVFYLDKQIMLDILNYLETYYDLD